MDSAAVTLDGGGVPARSKELKALGDAIRRLRRRRGLDISQEQLALKAGIDRAYMGAIERGEKNATYETLLRVAGGLELKLSAVIAEAESGR